MNNLKTSQKILQLLTGIGNGSWFEINKEGENFRIKRYSEEGVLECSRIFSTKSNNFDINKNMNLLTYQTVNNVK